MRWSFPKQELCFCQRVVAPVIIETCRTKEDADAEEDLWFSDDPRELTLRQNWKKDILEYCGKKFFFRVSPVLLVTLMMPQSLTSAAPSKNAVNAVKTFTTVVNQSEI